MLKILDRLINGREQKLKNNLKKYGLCPNNVTRFWYDQDEDIIKVEMIAGNFIVLRKGDKLLQDLKILDKDLTTFVCLFNKRINKKLVKDVKHIIKPENYVIILMKNGKQFKFDLKQRVSRGDYNLLETYNYIKALLR